MSPGGVLLILTALAVAYVVATTLVTVRRGGRGPADPPTSHLRFDAPGFPSWSGRPASSSVRPPLRIRTPRRAAAG